MLTSSLKRLRRALVRVGPVGAAVAIAIIVLPPPAQSVQRATQGVIIYDCGSARVNLCSIWPDGTHKKQLTRTGATAPYGPPTTQPGGRMIGFVFAGRGFVATPSFASRRAVIADPALKSVQPLNRKTILALRWRTECGNGLSVCLRGVTPTIVSLTGERVDGSPFLQAASWLDVGRLVVTRLSEDQNTLSYLSAPDYCCPQAFLTVSVQWAIADPSVSPDRRSVAVTLELPSSTVIATVSLATRRLRVVTRGSFDRQPAWSPDGKSIVFTRNDFLYVKRLGTSAARSLHVTGAYPTWAVG